MLQTKIFQIKASPLSTPTARALFANILKKPWPAVNSSFLRYSSSRLGLLVGFSHTMHTKYDVFRRDTRCTQRFFGSKGALLWVFMFVCYPACCVSQLRSGQPCPLGYSVSEYGTCEGQKHVGPSVTCPPGFDIGGEQVNPYVVRGKEYAKCGALEYYKGKVRLLN